MLVNNQFISLYNPADFHPILVDIHKQKAHILVHFPTLQSKDKV